MRDDKACQVPLIERLRQCPVTNIGIKQGAAWHNIPVEALLEEAADALTAAQSDVARLTLMNREQQSELTAAYSTLEYLRQERLKYMLLVDNGAGHD